MADEGFTIKGVVELVADEKSIDAVADDADRELAESRRGGARARPSPAAPGRPGAAREVLAGTGGAALAKQIGGEFGKVQEKSARAARTISPAVAGAIAGSVAKRGDGAARPSPADVRRRRGIQQAVVAGAVSGNLKSSILGIIKSGPFLAAAAIVSSVLIVAALPKLLSSFANRRLDKLTGLPGAEFSPELSALALRRRIRQRQRTVETGRIRGPTASALAMTADQSLDRLARIAAVIGVGIDKLLTFVLDRLDPFLTLIENALRSLFPGLFTGTGPASLNLPINLLFGTLRANALNPVAPVSVRP